MKYVFSKKSWMEDGSILPGKSAKEQSDYQFNPQTFVLWYMSCQAL